MRGFSKAIIAGNLTRDPEMRTTPNGATVCSFSVAVNRVFRDSSGNQQEDVSFIDCVAWGKGGELINQYAKKGTGILVSGRLEQRSFETKDGQKRSRTEIVMEDFNFLGNTNSGGNGGANAAQPAATDGAAAEEMPADIPEEPIDLSEIPF
ncbi:single-stranded DNA-binding protein [Candidatus Saccharibacteria bacterium]|nr:single-stranded DNA-binding protein [Candidatus Saccharibacteria bacterium]